MLWREMQLVQSSIKAIAPAHCVMSPARAAILMTMILDDESEIIWPDGDELFFEDDQDEEEESEEFGSGGSCHINTRIACCGRK